MYLSVSKTSDTFTLLTQFPAGCHTGHTGCWPTLLDETEGPGQLLSQL